MKTIPEHFNEVNAAIREYLTDLLDSGASDEAVMEAGRRLFADLLGDISRVSPHLAEDLIQWFGFCDDSVASAIRIYRYETQVDHYLALLGPERVEEMGGRAAILRRAN